MLSVITLFSSAPFINEFGKECYGNAGVRQSEKKLSIKLGLLKLDTNDFYLLILASFSCLIICINKNIV